MMHGNGSGDMMYGRRREKREAAGREKTRIREGMQGSHLLEVEEGKESPHDGKNGEEKEEEEEEEEEDEEEEEEEEEEEQEEEEKEEEEAQEAEKNAKAAYANEDARTGVNGELKEREGNKNRLDNQSDNMESGSGMPNVDGDWLEVGSGKLGDYLDTRFVEDDVNGVLNSDV